MVREISFEFVFILVLLDHLLLPILVRGQQPLQVVN